MAEKDIDKEADNSVLQERPGESHAGPARTIPVGGDPERVDTETTSDTGVAQEKKDPIQELQAKVAELEDQRLRALAELDNSRKRMARQIDELVRFANDRLLLELLDVVDNFERALKHVEENGAVGDGGLSALRSGTELIYSQMTGLLARYEVKPLESIGRRFDPKYHEALVHAESDQFDEGMVTAEINKGYTVGDRVLRHARVVVSKGKPQPPKPDEGKT